MRKYIFAQENFYLPGMLNNINEQDTSFLDCKHKYMMKSGAPPDKFGVMYRIKNSMVSQAELILRVITLWFLVLSQFFREYMGHFNAYKAYTCITRLQMSVLIKILKQAV